MENDDHYDPPIEIDLGDNPGPVAFYTPQQLIDWANVETNFWAQLPEVAGNARFVQAVTRHKNIGGELAARAANREESIQILGRYHAHEFIHSSSTIGKMAMDLSAESPIQASALLWSVWQWHREREGATVNHWTQDGNFVRSGSMVVDATARIAIASGAVGAEDSARQAAQAETQRTLVAAEGKWNAALASAAAALVSNQKKFDEAVAKQKTDFDAHMGDITGKNNALIIQATDKIAALEKLFNEKIQLEAPVEYWRAKEATHDKGLWLWGFLSAAITIVPIVAAIQYAPSVYDRFREFQSNLTTGGVAILLTFAVLYLALGRQVGRLFTTSLALRNDAAERVVMAQTFLALYQDKKLTDEERKLVLVPLFRPHGGSGEGDATAGLADLIAKVVSPSKP